MKNIISLLSFILLFNISIAHGQDEKLILEEKTFESKSGIKVQAKVGKLKVAENRKNPNSAEIEIHFVRLKSTNNSESTPLFYLEGGPGSSCSWQAEDPGTLENWLPFLELGDVILLDQRGTGAGTERTLYIWPEELPANLLSDSEVREARSAEMNKRALAAYKERGVDLDGYTTVENANDIEALRKALGFDKISLFGFSYGTHLGQTYIKYYGDQVENAVLVGVEGLNHTFKLPSTMDTQFHKISLMASQDENVNKDIPDMIDLYKRVIRKLDNKPITLEVISPLSQQPMKMEIGSFMLNLIIRFDIGDASDLPVFPKLLYNIEQGDYDAIQWFVQKRIRNFYGIHGMSATMDPASGATANRLERINKETQNSLFKDVVNPGTDDDQWPNPDLGDEFRAPLLSKVRTLFMSGTLDFNTPPYQAEEVKWGFSNSSHIIVDNAGHEQILTHPKATDTIIKFLKGENIDDTALSYPKLKFIPIQGESKELWHPSLDK